MGSFLVQRFMAAVVLTGVLGICASPAYAYGNPGYALFFLGVDAIGLIASVLIVLFLHKSPDLNHVIRNLLLMVSILLSLACNAGLQMLFFGFFKDADFKVWIWGLFVLAFCSIPFVFALDFLFGGISENQHWLFSRPTKIFAATTLILSLVFWAGLSATDFYSDTVRRKKWKLMHEKGLQVQEEASKKGLKYFKEYGLVGRGFFPLHGSLDRLSTDFVALSETKVTVTTGYKYYVMNRSMNSDPEEVRFLESIVRPEPLGPVSDGGIAAVCEFRTKDYKIEERGICTLDLNTGEVKNRYKIPDVRRDSGVTTIPVYVSQDKIVLFSFEETGVRPFPLTITTLDSALNEIAKVRTFFPSDLGVIDDYDVKLQTAFSDGAILRVHDRERSRTVCLKFRSDGELLWNIECTESSGLDIDGNFYTRTASGFQKFRDDGTADPEYSRKAESLKVEDSYPDNLNPFADFEARLNIGYDRRVLASREFLMYELTRRGFREVDSLPESWQGLGIKLEDFEYFKFDREIKIADTIVDDNNHVYILGEFAIERNGEVWINFAEVGLIDQAD